jgi:predicted nucleic acid-binding protein
MNAVDTNVLVYAWDPRDPAKQQTANDLLDAITDGVLLWQVAIEFLAASRKLVPFGFGLTEAFDEIRDMRRIWAVALPTEHVLDRAEDLIGRFSLSF